MISGSILAKAGALSLLAVLGVPSAHAATVTLDFGAPVTAPLSLDPDSPGIVSGNCTAGAAPCLGVNPSGAAVLSAKAPATTFSILSFWFQLLGKKNDLIVTTSKGTATLLERIYGHNDGGQTIDLSGDDLFKDITFVSFLTDKGNARVDDITVSHDDVAPVPLPAAGLMLSGALGGLAFLRRRKTA